MFVIFKEGVGEIEVKKSKFFSYAVHIDSFEEKQKLLKAQHPKARHIVWAYKKYNENGQLELKSTDDGEPKGTAGKPTLNVLNFSEISNVAIFTVRYFGGILLGTGGLVKAYSDVANIALQNCVIVNTDDVYERTLTVPFDKTQQFFYIIEKYELNILEQNFVETGIKVRICGKKDVVEVVEKLLGNKDEASY